MHSGVEIDGALGGGNVPEPPVVVLAGSLGGLNAMLEVLRSLPPQFPAALVVTLHRPRRDDRDQLPDVLGRRSTLPVHEAARTSALSPGSVHVLPPGSAFSRRGAMLDVEPSDRWRTADLTMSALAGHYGSRSIGVIVSGRLDDGALGARAIKQAGGRVIVQDPAEAAAPGMPAAALATGCVDLVVPLRRVAQTLVALTMAPGGADLLRIPRAPWAS
jgi:two-component system chemotaxis response regulator CheB